MHRFKLSLTILFGYLAVLFTANAQEISFSFEDGFVEDFIKALNGDIGSGKITIDPSNGDYEVEWNASSAPYSFHGPMRFELNLYNMNLGILVYLVGEYLDPTTPTQQFIHTGNEPLLINWEAGQQVMTAGSVIIDGTSIDFYSGIYSNNCGGAPCDYLDVMGYLVGTVQEVPPAEQDSDNDGIPDDPDDYDESDTRETVFLLEKNTWIPNLINGELTTTNGYTLADMIQLLETDADENSDNHGQYVQYLVRNFKLLVKDGLITQSQHVGLVRLVAKKSR